MDAARELLGGSGFGGLTVGGVAVQAKMAKTTICHHCHSRTDLALAVLTEGVSGVDSQLRTEDTATELVLLVNGATHLMNTTLWGWIMKSLTSEVTADAELTQVYREQVVSKRVADVRLSVGHDIAGGELRPSLDPETVTDLLLGPICYRLFFSGPPLDEDFGKWLVITSLLAFTAWWVAKWSLGSPRSQRNK